jgi:hypothetical protein
MRPAKSSEERVLQALRQTDCITKAQMDACIALLVATEPCDRCNETGAYPPENPVAASCAKCEGTGQMYTIR